MPDKINIHQNASDVRKGHRMLPYTGVRIIVETGNSTIADAEYFAGDETGTVLELNCPWGTQQIANDIFNSLSGYAYQPITVTGGWLNPAAELGDGVTANGIYGGIYKEETTFGHLFASDFSAPKDEEIDHEFTFVSPTDRKIARNRAQTRTEFIIKASEIAAKVEQTGGDNKSFGWSLIADGFGLYSGNKRVFFCNKDGISVDGSITARSGYIGNGTNGFTIGTKSISNGMDSRDDTANNGIYLGTDGIALGKGNFKVTNGGVLTAKSGYIGNGTNGFTIGNTAIHNNKASFSNTDNDGGIYLGTNGISLGRTANDDGSYSNAFQVSSNGALTANNATIHGTIKVKSITFDSGVTLNGSNITNGTVTDGKISGVSGSKVGSGIAGGNINSGSITKNRCNKEANDAWTSGVTAESSVNSLVKGTLTASTLSATSIKLGGYSLFRKNITIDGTTHNLIAYGIDV